MIIDSVFELGKIDVSISDSLLSKNHIGRILEIVPAALEQGRFKRLPLLTGCNLVLQDIFEAREVLLIQPLESVLLLVGEVLYCEFHFYFYGEFLYSQNVWNGPVHMRT